MKYDIVKFKNGEYGLRRRDLVDVIFNLSGKFKDFKPTAFYSWRKPSDKFFYDCQTNDLEKVKLEFSKYNGTFISEVLT